MSVILPPAEVAAMQVSPALDTALIATHWEGCERAHPRCAAVKLARSHEALRELAMELATALETTAHQPECPGQALGCCCHRSKLAKASEAGMLDGGGE
jgi:hypothetical protein